MKQAYDDAYTPPAPVVLVTIRYPEGGEQELRVNVLLDTGADVTVVPPALVRALRARPVAERTIQGTDGTSLGVVPAYFLEFELEGHRDLVEVVACGDAVIAGRNWLNSLHITLDGPEQTVAVEAPSMP